MVITRFVTHALTLCVLVVWLLNTAAAAKLPEVRVHITHQPPLINGILDDSAWKNARPISDFLQREPVMGAPATEQTEVRILRDSDHLYIGIRCFDTQPDAIVATAMRRDADVDDDDNVQIILDTYNDRRGGFYFATNALGARLDMMLSNEGRTRNRSWDSVWHCRAVKDSIGWSAEIAVPLDQLRFSATNDAVWGINVARTIRRKNERAFLVPPPLSYGFRGHLRTSRLATLTGLGKLTSRPRLEVTPYAQAGTMRDFQALDSDTQYKLETGADLKYGLTSSMTLDLSWRTDFAQVEADQEKVNLTRFNLFLPEKRDFFLEGADIFSFGERVQQAGLGRRPPTLLFYSRRIGLEAGHSIPVIAGGKLTGRSGPYQIGILNIATEAARFRDETTEDAYRTINGELLREDDPALEIAMETNSVVDTVEADFIDTSTVNRSHFSVFRIKRDLFSRSSVGMMVINREPGTESDHNRSLGLDADFSLLNAALNIRGFVARTVTDELDGRENAGLLEIDYRWRVFEARASYLDIGDAFNPEVGFVPRTDLRRFRTALRYRPLATAPWIRRYSIGPEFVYLTDLDGQLQTRDIRFSAFTNLETGDWIGFRIRHRFERLGDAFEIHDGIDIPSGKHRFATYSFNLFSDKARPLSTNSVFELGNFWNGKRLRFNVGATANVSNRLSVSSNYELNRVRLSQGNFTTNSMTNRVLYSFTTEQFLRCLLQWNSKREIIGINALWNWRYIPGSDLFLVYSQVWDAEDMGQRNRSLQCKLTYLWKP